jgi:TonB-dependent receptor
MSGVCAVALCSAGHALAGEAVATNASGAAPAAESAAQANAGGSGNTVQEVVVTGVRKQLRDQAAAKKDNVGISDSIFAEDIGKFPDQNLAEAVNRIPGVTISRDVDGEGEQISIRGLGTNFTKVTLNGSQIAVASDGSLDAGNSNREVDLDMFPTELFTKITVYKSMEAELLDGGSSGNVDMVNARPFDDPGQHLIFNFQEGYNSQADRGSPRGAVIASKTWGDKFGILFGVAGAVTQFKTDGFETIGWSTPKGYNYTSGANSTTPATYTPLLPGCTPDVPLVKATSCNAVNVSGPQTLQNPQQGGGAFTFNPTVTGVPAGAIPGVNDGDTLLNDFAALDPNITGTALSNTLFPRLGREVYDQGSRDRLSFLMSTEYRPTSDLRFSLDFLYGIADRQFNRLDMDWYVRNSNFMTPANVTADGNGVLQSGTFYNSQFFLEARPYQERLNFINFNPTMNWRINDWIKVDGQFNYNMSVFHRYEPSYLFYSPMTTVTYSDTNSSGIPSITPGANIIDNPTAGWTNYRENIQNNKRVTHNLGTHWNALFGDSKDNIKVGVAYDDVYRKIISFDASSAFQNCLQSGTGASYITYMGGKPVDENFQCSTPAITNALVGNFLSAGPSITVPGAGYTAFVQPNYKALEANTPLSFYNRYAPFSGNSALSTPSGIIEEKTTGLYIEANGQADWLGHKIKFNAGGRYFTTDQSVASSIGVSTPNASIPEYNVSASGGFVADGTDTGTLSLPQWQTLKHTYDAWLPSFNVEAFLTNNLILRLAGSRTVTRPNPNVMLPGTSFTDPSAQTANQGNPNIAPFYSNNFDVGLELYTGGPGIIAFDEFNKSITGYTVNGSYTEPFSQLGLPLSALSPTQLGTGITESTLITVNTQVNAPGTLIINGQEINYVQPLDFITKGLGVNGTFTHVDYTETGGGVAAPTGVPHFTYNVAGWYENHGFSMRVTWVWMDRSVAALAPQNNVSLNYYNDPYGQLDMSASYVLPWWGGRTQVTFNATNLNGEAQRTYVGYEKAAYTYYSGNTLYMLGLRAKF